MKKILTRLIIIPLLLITAVTYLNAQSFVSPYEPSVVKAFADSLLEEGFLTQAEGEYKRYLFSFDRQTLSQQSSDPEFQSTLLSLCNIYKQQSNKSGVQWLDEQFYTYAQNSVKEKMSNLNAGFLFKERDELEFSAFTYRLSNSGAVFSPDFSNLLQVSDLVLEQDIKKLGELTAVISLENDVFVHLNELCTSYKTKKPGLALFLSMILPGSGRWYTGSFAAFTGSFLTIGSFVAGTVLTGIKTQWKGWQPYVFGACGLVLYITDLYGSWKSAQRYNDALFRHLCEETENIYEKIY